MLVTLCAHVESRRGADEVAVARLTTRTLEVYKFGTGTASLCASAKLPKEAGNLTAVLLAKDRVYLLHRTPTSRFLSVYSVQKNRLAVAERLRVPNDASSMATDRDGRVWIGLQRGRLVRPGDTVPMRGRNDGDAVQLKLDEAGRWACMDVSSVVGQTDSGVLYVFATRKPSKFADRAFSGFGRARSDFGLYLREPSVWTIEKSGSVRCARLSRQGKLGAFRSWNVGIPALKGVPIGAKTLAFLDQSGRALLGEFKNGSWHRLSAIGPRFGSFDEQTVLHWNPALGAILVANTTEGSIASIPINGGKHFGRVKNLASFGEACLVSFSSP